MGNERLNNFDLIRLVAAMEVVLWHGIEHLGLGAPPLLRELLGTFPGVPIFFVVSGYLVTASFRRSFGIDQYFKNRALRIFPGLWACFIFSSGSIAIVHGFESANLLTVATWIIPNIVGISYTPTFLRDFGTGSVNGSLWTIPVELQFYLILPMLVPFLGRNGLRWIGVFVAGLIASLLYIHFLRGMASSFAVNVSLRALPTWLYMFMLGMFFELRQDWVRRFMVDRFAIWITAYMIWSAVARAAGVNTVGNAASPVVLIPLAGVVVSAAYSYRQTSVRVLGHNDISYGVYLYHMPIINLIVSTAPFLMNWGGLIVCVVLTSAVAAGSWAWVERPALRRKWTFTSRYA